LVSVPEETCIESIEGRDDDPVNIVRAFQSHWVCGDAVFFLFCLN
jgi:hypothetical protein